MTKAAKLLDEIIQNTWLRDGRKHLGPGQIILCLSQEKRETLSELKSDDIKDIRLYK